MPAEDFWARVRDLQSALSITPRGGGVKDRKRIALAVTDAFLTAGGPLHQAAVLEWQLFEATAGLGLTCDLLPHEERCTEQVKDPKRARSNSMPAPAKNSSPLAHWYDR